MFKIGDKVVYPMHGAGIIESIEEKEILGEKQQYYVLRLPIGSMRVMVPTASGENIGLRQVIDRKEVQKVFGVLKDHSSSPMPGNWNRRYRANLEKIKSGNIYKVAEVVRNLARREREKGLSSGEKRMLESARQILISELVLAAEIEEDKARTMLDEMLA
ncbi:MAG: CarD family transcriptional regulator [Peptococcaceae bacterium]|nr:CarD family transcriptional regulator [Peptococcaceae bacterium]